MRMEPNVNAAIRDKVLQAEGKRVEWNSDRVWNSLDVAKPVKKKPVFWYYAAASVAILVSLVLYTNQEKTKSIATKRELKIEAKQPAKINPEAALLLVTADKKGIVPVKLKATSVPIISHAVNDVEYEKSTVPVVEMETEEPLLIAVSASVNKPNTKKVRRKIEAIVGVVPYAEGPQVASAVIPVKVSFYKPTSPSVKVAIPSGGNLLTANLNHH